MTDDDIDRGLKAIAGRLQAHQDAVAKLIGPDARWAYTPYGKSRHLITRSNKVVGKGPTFRAALTAALKSLPADANLAAWRAALDEVLNELNEAGG